MKREKLKLSTILSYALATGSGYQIMGSLVGAYRRHLRLRKTRRENFRTVPVRKVERQTRSPRVSLIR